MSPDLNPIENLWQELNNRVRAREPGNINELETYCCDEWENISQNIWTNLSVNYKIRFLEIIQNWNFSINY